MLLSIWFWISVIVAVAAGIVIGVFIARNNPEKAFAAADKAENKFNEIKDKVEDKLDSKK